MMIYNFYSNITQNSMHIFIWNVTVISQNRRNRNHFRPSPLPSWNRCCLHFGTPSQTVAGNWMPKRRIDWEHDFVSIALVDVDVVAAFDSMPWRELQCMVQKIRSQSHRFDRRRNRRTIRRPIRNQYPNWMRMIVPVAFVERFRKWNICLTKRYQN